MSDRAKKMMAAVGVRLRRVHEEDNEHVTWEVTPSQSIRQESDHLEDNETRKYSNNEIVAKENPYNDFMRFNENQQLDSNSSTSVTSSSSSQIDASSEDSNYTTGDESSTDSNSRVDENNPPRRIVRDKQITKKRPKKTAEWRRNVCKKLRNCGQKYETLSKNKVLQERKILTPCNEKCRLKCTGKFTDEHREHIFNTFWKLGDLQKQRSFVLSSMRTIPKQYTKVEKDYPEKYFYKTSYNQTEFKSVIIHTRRQNTRQGTSSIANYELTSAYQQPLPVSKRKFDDLQSLLSNRSISSAYSGFFQQLRKEN
ncbi:unnamed protein product [Psylliodes chrysocephalus]|uniref:Uncharacterized protein n=1 Tax=Psylliodes chrysocephalus TaxID=3402493 RepID=A0A9P0GBC2_9CUCU|nr:unnamed protein product [Psylliodes chrysocephala]